MLSESKRLSTCQSPLLKKCNTERQRKKCAADGAAAHGWIAASIQYLLSGLPGQQQHHHLKPSWWGLNCREPTGRADWQYSGCSCPPLPTRTTVNHYAAVSFTVVCYFSLDYVADTSTERKVPSCVTTGGLKLSSKINWKNKPVPSVTRGKSVGWHDREHGSWTAMKMFSFLRLGFLVFWISIYIKHELYTVHRKIKGINSSVLYDPVQV